MVPFAIERIVQLTLKKEALRNGVASLAEMVKMCTAVSVKTQQKLTSWPGLLVKGAAAHIILVDKKSIDREKHAFYNGALIYHDVNQWLDTYR